MWRLCLNVGGPVRHGPLYFMHSIGHGSQSQEGVNGFLVTNASQLMVSTAHIFALPPEERRAMWDAAQARAADFTYGKFEKRLVRRSMA